MKILHVIGALDPKFGGLVTALKGLVEAQLQAGLSVKVVANIASGEVRSVADELSQAGAAVTLIGPAHTKLRWHPSMARVLKSSIADADVVHIHGVWEEIQHRAAVIAHRLKIPYVLTPHGMLDPWSLSQSRLQKRLILALRVRRDLERAALIHFTSVAERDGSVNQLGLTAPVTIRPNGVQIPAMHLYPPMGEFRELVPEIGDRRILLFLSRVHLKKGIELLLSALARLKDKKLVLVIVGPGDLQYIDELKRLAGIQGIADQVIFAGQRDGREKLAAFVDADLFVLPSYQENFGLAVAESISMGLPVLISDQVNIHSEVTSLDVGVVVPLDVEAIVSGLRKALNDTALQARVKAHGRRLVSEKWSWSTIAAQWKDEYSRMCGRTNRNG